MTTLALATFTIRTNSLQWKETCHTKRKNGRTKDSSLNTGKSRQTCVVRRRKKTLPVKGFSTQSVKQGKKDGLQKYSNAILRLFLSNKIAVSQ